MRRAQRFPVLWALALVPVITALALLLHPSSGRADPAIEPEEAAFLEILNAYRTQNGRIPLLLHPQLNAAADWFAVDMATDNYWGSGHWDNEDPPRLPPARAQAFGYYYPVGENIAGGYGSAQSVFTAWQGSPGHNSNMLYTSYRVIGIGRAYNASSQFHYYWVTDFGTVNSVVPTPSPGPATSPAATPTEQPTSVPTPPPTPTASPTPSPSATPTPNPVHVWTDLDCSGGTEPGDTIAILAAAASVASASSGEDCPAVGSIVIVDGIPRLFGDINCSGVVGPPDTVVLLRYLSGFGWSPPALGCPPPGTVF